MVIHNLNCVVRVESSSAFLKGACHWVANPVQATRGANNVILIFSLADEKFRTMEVPECLVFEDGIENKYDVRMNVSIYNGLLSLIPLWKCWQRGSSI